MIHIPFPKSVRRFFIFTGAVNIRLKILGIVLGLVLLLGFTVAIQVRQLLAQNMYDQLHDQAISIGRDLAARSTDFILINDLYSLHQLITDTQAIHTNVRYAFILDKDGSVLGHTFGDGFPLDLLSANSVASTDYENSIAIQTDEGQIWDVAVPIFDGRAGIARVGISDQLVIMTINAITSQLLLTTILVSAIGISAATFLTWVLTRPILELVRATQAVKQGDFSHQVTVSANDEIGELIHNFNDMTHTLAKSHSERLEREQLRVQYVNGVITAQEDERKRIARELHDSTSQSLTSLLVGLRTMGDTCQRCVTHNRIDELRTIASHILDDVHRLALQLRPSVLDDLGLPEAIRKQVAEYQKHHPIQIDVMIIGLDDQRLPPTIETALYRITQEALTNIVRHANAKTASILIESQKDKALVIIDDDGKGFNPDFVYHKEGHLGLYGMKERAELLGGQMVIESGMNSGTSLYIEIPLIQSEVTS